MFGIDAEAVIGRIADIAMALRGGLHIGADAAEPEQVGRRLQDGGDEGAGLHLGIGDVEYRLHFRGKRNALETA